jgi:ribose 5-phosphate isomerase B
VQEHAVELDVTGSTITPSAIDLAHRLGVLLRGLPGEDAKVTRGGRQQAAAPAARAHVSGPASVVREATLAPLKVSLGADHGGLALKEVLAGKLRESGHTVLDHGTAGPEPVDYPDFAVAVARAVASGASRFGIMIDGAGIGSCMAANKVRGVRAAMCYDVTTATNAREHNDANVLTLGGGMIGFRLALDIVEAFLRTPFGGGRHAARVEKINALDAASAAEVKGPRPEVGAARARASDR